MPTLRELQTAVMEALLGDSPESVTPLIAATDEGAAERFRIHVNTVQTKFADALRSTFPAVQRLVGDEYFRRAARELQRRHPSRSGDLVHAG